MISDILENSPEIPKSGDGTPEWGIGIIVIGAVFLLYWFWDKFKTSKKEDQAEKEDESNGSESSEGKPPESN